MLSLFLIDFWLLKASLSAFFGKTVESPVLAQNFYFSEGLWHALRRLSPGDEEA